MDCPEPGQEPKSHDERLAQQILEPHLGNLIPADPPLPDYLICSDGLVVGGVEVTMARHPGYMTLSGQLQAKEFHLAAPSLRTSWMARLDWDTDWRDVDHGELMHAAEQIDASCDKSLAELPAHHPIHTSLKRLGVSSMLRWDTRDREEASKLYLNAASVAAVWDGGHAVNSLMADELRRKQKQLARHQSGHRHFFVWIGPEQIRAAIGLSESLPDDAPRLPDYVDHLWVSEMRRDSQLWHTTGDGSWRVAL